MLHCCPAGADHSGQHAFRCHVFQYDDLQLATSCFSSQNIVGEGGFGRVYQGRLADGPLVAVKRLDRHGMQVYTRISLVVTFCCKVLQQELWYSCSLFTCNNTVKLLVVTSSCCKTLPQEEHFLNNCLNGHCTYTALAFSNAAYTPA